jgi:hypothetical protein
MSFSITSLLIPNVCCDDCDKINHVHHCCTVNISSALFVDETRAIVSAPTRTDKGVSVVVEVPAFSAVCTVVFTRSYIVLGEGSLLHTPWRRYDPGAPTVPCTR